MEAGKEAFGILTEETGSVSSQSNKLIDLEIKPFFARMKIGRDNKFCLNSPGPFAFEDKLSF